MLSRKMARICNRFRVKSTQILEWPNFFMKKYFVLFNMKNGIAFYC